MFFLRSLLPSTNRGILVIKPWKVAYARVPKAANTSAKVAIAETLGLPSSSAGEISRDAFWRGQDRSLVEVVSPEQFASSRFSGYQCFTIVRHPLARLTSCYKNKVVRNRTIRKGLVRDGLRLGMNLDEFVNAVCRTNDRSCNVHLRSQASMLTYRGRIIPNLVVPFESIDRGWADVIAMVEAQAGVRLPPLQTRNSTTKVSVSTDFSSEQEERLRQRYALDFELFYPEDR